MQIINFYLKKRRRASEHAHEGSKKKLQLLLISKVYHLYLFEK